MLLCWVQVSLDLVWLFNWQNRGLISGSLLLQKAVREKAIPAMPKVELQRCGIKILIPLKNIFKIPWRLETACAERMWLRPLFERDRKALES